MPRNAHRNEEFVRKRKPLTSGFSSSLDPMKLGLLQHSAPEIKQTINRASAELVRFATITAAVTSSKHGSQSQNRIMLHPPSVICPEANQPAIINFSLRPTTPFSITNCTGRTAMPWAEAKGEVESLQLDLMTRKSQDEWRAGHCGVR